jgi:hypothetical protein
MKIQVGVHSVADRWIQFTVYSKMEIFTLSNLTRMTALYMYSIVCKTELFCRKLMTGGPRVRGTVKRKLEQVYSE